MKAASTLHGLSSVEATLTSGYLGKDGPLAPTCRSPRVLSRSSDLVIQ